MKPFDDDFRELRNDHAGQLPAGTLHARRADVGSLGGGRGGVVPHTLLGIGGRLSSSYLRVSVNNVSQTENLKCASASAGLYLSYPFSVR